MLKTLVLNADYTPVSYVPLSVISAKQAIVRVLENRYDVVYNYETPIKTPSRFDLYWPSVIINKKFVRQKPKVNLNKTSLFYRDNGKCQYCGDDLTIHSLTCDHVIPESLGGKKTWSNIVAACRPCNSTKSNSQPTGKWKPSKAPYEPTLFEILHKRKHFPIVIYDERWTYFLDNFDTILRSES